MAIYENCCLSLHFGKVYFVKMRFLQHKSPKTDKKRHHKYVHI